MQTKVFEDWLPETDRNRPPSIEHTGSFQQIKNITNAAAYKL